MPCIPLNRFLPGTGVLYLDRSRFHPISIFPTSTGREQFAVDVFGHLQAAVAVTDVLHCNRTLLSSISSLHASMAGRKAGECECTSCLVITCHSVTLKISILLHH